MKFWVAQMDMSKWTQIDYSDFGHGVHELFLSLADQVAPAAKHEKADVLEMAVEYLHNLRRRKVQSKMLSFSIKPILPKFSPFTQVVVAAKL